MAKNYDKNIVGECEKARVMWFAFIIVLSVSVVLVSALILDLKDVCEFTSSDTWTKTSSAKATK